MLADAVAGQRSSRESTGEIDNLNNQRPATYGQRPITALRWGNECVSVTTMPRRFIEIM
jgi:hypothetical protein